jgi:predicted DsbA family dithiol-disulfide isomerase
MNAPLEIDVYSDIVCPWCFIGMERLDRVLEALDAPDAVVRYHPFMLRPDAPEGGLEIAGELRRKYGVEPAQLFARVESAARESGIELDLSKQPLTYPTVRAHALLEHAGPKGTQRALAKALFRAHFMDAKNISDPDTLADIAALHGFTRDEAARIVRDDDALAATRSEAENAARLGIRGVPLFIVNGRRAISGSQPESVFRELLQEELRAPGS